MTEEIGPAAKPAPYADTDFRENEAIQLFINSLDRKQVRTDIKSRDKYPNSDGYVEIVDESNTPIGKLEIQVRTIGRQQLVYRCAPKLMAYSDMTTLPMLLILSDVDEGKVYWKHLHSASATLTRERKSYKFKLSESDLVIKANAYVLRWTSIAQEYARRIREFPDMEEAARLSSLSVQPHSLSVDAMRYFQSFVDSLNLSLDVRYPFAKRTLFPGVWKLGVSVSGFGDSISFGIYPVETGKSDLLIKEIDSSAKIDLLNSPFLSFQSFRAGDRPPEDVANHLVLSSPDRILRTLSVNCLFGPPRCAGSTWRTPDGRGYSSEATEIQIGKNRFRPSITSATLYRGAFESPNM